MDDKKPAAAATPAAIAGKPATTTNATTPAATTPPSIDTSTKVIAQSKGSDALSKAPETKAGNIAATEMYRLGPQPDGAIVIRIRDDYDLVILRLACVKQEKNAVAAQGTVGVIADGEDSFLASAHRALTRLIKQLAAARAPANQIADTPIGKAIAANKVGDSTGAAKKTVGDELVDATRDSDTLVRDIASKRDAKTVLDKKKQAPAKRPAAKGGKK